MHRSGYLTKQHLPELQQAELPSPAANGRCCSTFYQVTSPLIFVLRLFGGFPYTVRKDRLHVTLCSWWVYYSLVVMIFQNVLLFLTTHHIYFGDDNAFDAKLFDIISIIIMIYQASGPLTFWFELPAITRYYTKWHTFENDLHLCNIKLDGRLKKWVFLSMLPSIPYVFIAAYFQSVIHGNLLHMPSLVFLHIHNALHVSFWFISGLFIHSTAFRIMVRIKKVAEDRDPVEIAACRRIWLSLAELTADLGNALGPTLMEVLLFSSTVLIVGCYFVMFFFRSPGQEGKKNKSDINELKIFQVGSDLLQELLRLNTSPQEKQLYRED
ncbi:unnamed protein product [Nezara viridula]|uniref:Gustatory receptor n=1 Tax=Nezara viridula TaxID=85310 RepID=A0A9P0E138_NEZVI|nr:unnamed protein product [Nezara viridula]